MKKSPCFAVAASSQSNDGDFRRAIAAAAGAEIVIAAGNTARAVGRAVLVHVQENVPFDPGVGAVEIEDIIAAADEDVIEILDDGLTQVAVAAGEIHDVVVTVGCAEETMPHNAPASGLDSLGPMHQLEGGRRGGKRAVADHERGAVKRDVLMSGGAKCQMIEVDRPTSYFDTGVAVALEMRVGDEAFRGAGPAVDREAAPGAPGAGVHREANPGAGRALGQ